MAFDIASEATARAYNNDQSGPPSDQHDELQGVLEAVEHVFRATLANGRVPMVQRLRTRDSKPTTLTEQARADIMTLCREQLPHGSRAEQTARVLQRDAPDTPALRCIHGSGLVHVPPPPDRRPADQAPPA